MNGRRMGFIVGLAAFTLALLVPPPSGMPREAWLVAGLVVWMAAWWMTEAVLLTATALLPFLVLPLSGVMDANATASAYYSPTLFLILGGAFIALAIERTNLHCRLALGILQRLGQGGGSTRLLLAFMIATALLSTLISNTSTALIMMPMALLPSGTGPNAIAWATGRVALPRMLRAGFALDLAGTFLIVGAIWAVAALT